MRCRTALFLALLGAGCAEPRATENPSAVLLHARVRPAMIDGWREPASLEALTSAKMIRQRLRPYVRRVALGTPADERLALLAPSGSAYRFELTLPPEAMLTLSLGGIGSAAANLSTTAEVWLDDRLGEPRLLLRRSVRSHDTAWRPEVVDLAAWGGKAVNLTLRAAAPHEGPWLAWGTPVVQPADSPADGWNVLLVSLDTLRADHLGCYGYDRPTSPRLDEFAGAAFRFAETVSSAPWTHPAHRSLFSGIYPKSDENRRRRPLAEVLWQAGYRTVAVTGGGQMDYRMGFARGFESYREENWIATPDRMADEIAAAAAEARPFFIFLHTYEPHDPYLDTRFADNLPAGRLAGTFSHGIWRAMDRELTADEKRYVEALYDGDIAFTDEQIGTLLDELEARGVLDRTVVVITGDHGEQFWEHGTWRHGQNLYDHQLLVPLIVSLPAGLREALDLQAPGLISQPVRLIDVYPTLLDLLDVAPEVEPQGRSLVPLLAGRDLPEVESLAEDLNLDDQESKAVRYRGYKYISRIHPDGQETTELYDLRADPKEQHNLVETRARDAARMRRRLHALVGSEWWTDESKSAKGRDLPEDLRNRLEALGYLGN